MAVNWVPSTSSRELLSTLDAKGRPKPARVRPSALEPLLARVRAEYREMPGLSVTRDQAQCLWGLDRELCDEVLARLVDAGFLRRTERATFVLRQAS